MEEFSAVRTWNPAHTKATIMVTMPGIDGKPVVKKVGGNRAARATIAFVVRSGERTWETVNGPVHRPAQWKFLGLRADPGASLSKQERDYYEMVVVVPVTEPEGA